MLLHRLKKFSSSPANFVMEKSQELPLAAAATAPWQHSLSLCLTFDSDWSSDLFKVNSAGGTGITIGYFHRWSCSQLTRCSGLVIMEDKIGRLHRVPS